MDEYKSISQHLNEAMLEIDIELCKQGNIALSVIAFYCKVDLDNIFLFRDLIKRIYSLFSQSKIVYNDKNSLFLFAKNKNLHESVTLFSKAKKIVKTELGISINKIGITELSKKDTLEDLIKRVKRYYITSRRLSVSKIVYGTREFDYFDDRQRDDSLNIILKDEPSIWIYNFYSGIPIKEKGIVFKYDDDRICIKCSKEELMYLKKYEKFVYLKHRQFPIIIKGDIANINIENEFFCIGNITFQDMSVVDRENVRIVPDKTILVSIECQGGVVGNGTVENISVDSLAVKVDDATLRRVMPIRREKFTLKFSIYLKIKKAISSITLRGKIVKINGNAVVFIFEPNDFVKTKLESYINSAVEDIKSRLKQTVLAG